MEYKFTPEQTFINNFKSHYVDFGMPDVFLGEKWISRVREIENFAMMNPYLLLMTFIIFFKDGVEFSPESFIKDGIIEKKYIRKYYPKIEEQERRLISVEIYFYQKILLNQMTQTGL